MQDPRPKDLTNSADRHPESFASLKDRLREESRGGTYSGTSGESRMPRFAWRDSSSLALLRMTNQALVKSPPEPGSKTHDPRGPAGRGIAVVKEPQLY